MAQVILMTLALYRRAIQIFFAFYCRQENIQARKIHYLLYCIHFEINHYGIFCNLIGSQDCDFSTNRTLSYATNQTQELNQNKQSILVRKT